MHADVMLTVFRGSLSAEDRQPIRSRMKSQIQCGDISMASNINLNLPNSEHSAPIQKRL